MHGQLSMEHVTLRTNLRWILYTPNYSVDFFSFFSNVANVVNSFTEMRIHSRHHKLKKEIYIYACGDGKRVWHFFYVYLQLVRASFFDKGIDGIWSSVLILFLILNGYNMKIWVLDRISREWKKSQSNLGREKSWSMKSKTWERSK